MAADREYDADFKSHERSYARFAGMMKWGTIISFLVGAIVVVIISS